MIITIIVAEQPKGLYTASLPSGELVVSDSSAPLRPAARKLLETGQAQADDVLEMRRAGGPVDMRGIVGKLAKQAVREDPYVGPIVVQHRPRPDRLHPTA